LKAFARLQQGAAFDATLRLVAELPVVPDEVKKRFPSMIKYDLELKEWHKRLLLALKGGQP